MNTFYSILSAVINPVSGEKISVGLLLSDGNRSLFDFSENRLSLLNSLIDKETKKFIRQYLKSIDTVLNKIDINQDQLTILDEAGKNLVVNEPYIAYLSVYNQNVISFSNPVSIDVKVEEQIFIALFSKFIDDETNVKSHIKSHFQLIKSDFFPRIKNYYSIEKEITPDRFKKILLPVSIDLLGKNDKYVTGQFFDLEKSVYHIKNDWYDYNQANKIIKSGKKFVVSAEPDKTKFPQQHHFWNELGKIKSHTFLDISELERIEEYAKKHDVKPVE
jgi:hypothetical protein